MKKIIIIITSDAFGNTYIILVGYSPSYILTVQHVLMKVVINILLIISMLLTYKIQVVDNMLICPAMVINLYYNYVTKVIFFCSSSSSSSFLRSMKVTN